MKTLITLLLFPLILVAQTIETDIPVHLREIPKHNLSVDLGIAEPIGDYGDVARSGLTAAVTYDLYFTKHIGLTAGLRHTYNETAFEVEGGSTPQNENLTSITAGLIGSQTFNRFQVDGFARMGIGFIKTNTGFYQSRNDNQFYASMTDEYLTQLSMEAGLRFNYYFRRSAQVYFSPQFQTTLGKPLSYNRFTGPPVISPDILIRFDEPEFNLKNLLLSVGVKFAMGKKYTSGELRDDSDN